MGDEQWFVWLAVYISPSIVTCEFHFLSFDNLVSPRIFSRFLDNQQVAAQTHQNVGKYP